MKTFAIRRPARALAATGLCMLALPALAQDPAAVSALVYGGGEALSPQAESQLRALQLPASAALTRAEVREQLLQAQADGTLAGAGEDADRPSVLMARVAANDRQARQLLAAREATEREALRVAEATREAAQREAGQRAQAGAAATPMAAASADAAAPAVEPALAAAPQPALETSAPAVPQDGPRPVPSEQPVAPAATAAPPRAESEGDED